MRGPLEIYTNRSGFRLGTRICEILSKEYKRTFQPKKVLVRPNIEKFACGEFKITLEGSVRGKDIFLIQNPMDTSSDRSIQDNLWETLMTLDTLRHCHASNIALVMPYFAYCRQDKRDGREPLTAKLLAQMFKTAGADTFITIDLHSSQIKGFFEAAGLKCDALYSTNIFVNHLKGMHKNLIIMAPDHGARKRADYYAKKLFGNSFQSKVVSAVKRRSENESSIVEHLEILGDVKGKQVIIVDDLLDTAGTMEKVVLASHKQGAKEIIACITHPLLSEPSVKRLERLHKKTNFTTLLTTDTIMHSDEFIKNTTWFTQLSVAPMLADMITRINKQKPTSQLYL